MKLNINFNSFVKNYKKKRNQIIFFSKKCKKYENIENIFNYFLSEPNSFIFESVEKGKIRGRYTIIGLRPDKIWDFNKNTISIKSDNNQSKKMKVDPLKFLNNLINQFDIQIPKGLPNMSSMLVGYFSYDIIRYIEKIPDNCHDKLKIPDVRIMRPKNLIIYDNQKKRIFFIENHFFKRNINNYYEEYEKIKQNLINFEDFEKISLPREFTFQKNYNSVKSNISKKKFKSIVIKAKKHIKKGDIFQVVLSQRFERKILKKPLEIYNQLRKTNPSPFMFYFNYDDFKVLGSSPEILVRLRNNKITIRPIAGTRPRGKNLKEDQRLKRDLMSDRKELAEHLMLLDLGRNDVGKVSRVNTVKVTEKFKVEKYSHVMHIVSNVEGKFNQNSGMFEAFLSGFPAGTVSGAPKIRAMELIDKFENDKRKLYAGGIGYFTPNSEFDTCIALRTALIKKDKLFVQSGAGIVADSNPEKEYIETLNKAKAILKASD